VQARDLNCFQFLAPRPPHRRKLQITPITERQGEPEALANTATGPMNANLTGSEAEDRFAEQV
jgi:hypothetical protein